MKILYLVNSYPRTSHTFIRREIQALENLGLDVVRVSVRPPDGSLLDAADVEEARKTHVLLGRGALGLLPHVVLTLLRHPIRFARTLVGALRLSRRSDAGLLRHLAYFAEACALARLAVRAAVDHVHAHFGTNPPLVALLAEGLGAPGFSFTVHGPEEFDRAVSLKLAEKMAAARFTVAISSFGRAQLQRFGLPADHGRIHVVPCGLGADFLERTGAPSPDSRALLFIGRLCPQKQPLLLVEAASRLAADGLAFHVRVVGTGELHPAMASAIRAAGLERHFCMLGPLDGAGVLAELEACRAFVLPSAAEGLPVVLMEALALERPVITTYVAGIPELVRAGREGWLIPAGDALALSEAMRAALQSSPSELRRMGASGAERVRQRHDVRDSARTLAGLFHRYQEPP